MKPRTRTLKTYSAERRDPFQWKETGGGPKCWKFRMQHQSSFSLSPGRLLWEPFPCVAGRFLSQHTQGLAHHSPKGALSHANSLKSFKLSKEKQFLKSTKQCPPLTSRITDLLRLRGLCKSMKLSAMLWRVTHDGWDIMKSSDKMWYLCSKSSKLGFKSMQTENFQMYKLGLKKAEEPEIKLLMFIGSQKNQGIPENIYFCFSDYAKTFVRTTTNWKILKQKRIPDHLICLLRNLYAGQEATVRTGYGTTDWFKIGKGV